MLFVILFLCEMSGRGKLYLKKKRSILANVEVSEIIEERLRKLF
jgi:hypothetical protein